MTKKKRIEKNAFIESALYATVIKRNGFDDWLDQDVFNIVAKTCNCSVHLVKKIWYKKIKKENPNFVNGMEY